MSADLRPETIALLRRMHSRREMRLAYRKHPETGYHIFECPRVRTESDYVRIAKHPRAPSWARERAERWINGAVAEARRWEPYGDRHEDPTHGR